MKRYVSILLILLSVLVLGYFISFSEKKVHVDYSSQIKPIINKHCISCHGGVKKNGGFSLLFREEAMANTDAGHKAIIPGDPDRSPLIQRLKESDPELRMPYEKPPLSQEQISLLEEWVRQGAEWGKHWAYIPPVKPEVPIISATANVSAKEDDFFKNEIDHFIYHTMQEKNLEPESIADSATLLRRLHLDLIGLPPESTTIEAYLKENMSYEDIVDQLLKNENFGEKWASWWLDLARYADSKGYEADKARLMWRFRDYVIRSFNADKPFDQFTIEQLAGDLLPDPHIEELIATAFHRNTMSNDEGGTDN